MITANLYFGFRFNTKSGFLARLKDVFAGATSKKKILVSIINNFRIQEFTLVRP